MPLRSRLPRSENLTSAPATFDLVADLRQKGITILIVEQNVHHVLQASDRAYVLENGRVVLEGRGQTLLRDERLKVAYLGL
jgi:branched-chain amino acid transport system ATP-binding protein